jgi:hypothetical protein
MKRVKKMIGKLNIEATDSTPKVMFETNGNLLMKGRSFLMDVRLFYQPLIDWVSQLNVNKVRFTFKLEYCNSASLRQLIEILKIIDSNDAVHEFDIIWKFETDDEDILEMGQMFEEKLKKAKFLYKEYAET